MSETNTFQASSGSTDEPAREADVMPTASDQIAQWLAETEAMLANDAQFKTSFHRGERYRLREIVRRLRPIMESINAGKV